MSMVNTEEQQSVSGTLAEQHPELPGRLHQQQPKSWGETNLYSYVRAWVRGGTGRHMLSNDLDHVLSDSLADTGPSVDQPTSNAALLQSKGPLEKPLPHPLEAMGTRLRSGFVAAAMSTRSSYPTSSSSNFSI